MVYPTRSKAIRDIASQVELEHTIRNDFIPPWGTGRRARSARSTEQQDKQPERPLSELSETRPAAQAVVLVNLRTDQLQRNPVLAISNQVKRKAHVSRSQRPGRSHPVDKTVYRISIFPHDIHSITACAQHILFTPVFSTG